MRVTVSKFAQQASTAGTNLIFFGSDSFSLLHLKALSRSGRSSIANQFYPLQHVITASERTPVAEFCRCSDIPFSIWPRDSTATEDSLLPKIAQLRFPNLLGLVISFGRFLSPRLISMFPLGCINFHPSLLPRWRGPSPLFHTLVTGDTVSGVTVVRLPATEHTFDSGPIMYQRSISVVENHTKPLTVNQLARYIGVHSVDVMFEILNNPIYLDPNAVMSQSAVSSQTGLKELHAPRPTLTMGCIDWHRHSAADLVRLWHALCDTPFPLHTRLSLTNDQFVEVHLSPQPPQVIPTMDGTTQLHDIQNPMDAALYEAASMLGKIPSEFPAGGLVYLRSQHLVSHTLLPYAFVACQSAHDEASGVRRSWLAIRTIKLRIAQDSLKLQSRRLTALDLYNGYLNRDPISPYQRFQFGSGKFPAPGYHFFRGFSSFANVLWPLAEPWDTETARIELSSPLYRHELWTRAVNRDSQ